MIRPTLFLLGAVMAFVVTGQAPAGGAKKSDLGEVEMVFANGSVVRMTLLPDEIEIVTQYGKLLVPAREIRRIDFGMRLSADMDKKIGAAVKKLASTKGKEGDDAALELVALGGSAYPALAKAARSGDAETARRARDALAKLKAKIPAKDLQLGDDDKVVTPRFTIVGHITTPSIKAKSEYFGDVEHSLAKLRHMRSLGGAGDTEVIVDAGKYALPNQWLDTGIALERSRTLNVTASGEVELRPRLPGNYVCGPKGFTRVGFKKKGGGNAPAMAYPGTLLGRIGDNGETFVIGDRFEAPLERDGKLYLQIKSSPYDTNSTGSYQVKVLVRD